MPKNVLYILFQISIRLGCLKKYVQTNWKSKECNINLTNLTFSFVFVICNFNIASPF